MSGARVLCRNEREARSSKPSFTYDYTAFGDTISFKYDPFGRRIVSVRFLPSVLGLRSDSRLLIVGCPKTVSRESGQDILYTGIGVAMVARQMDG